MAADRHSGEHMQTGGGLIASLHWRPWWPLAVAFAALLAAAIGVFVRNENALGATFTVLDNFTIASYSNNNGTNNWSTSWVESDNQGGGATGGYLQVTGGRLQIRAGATGNWIYRQANLTGAVAATLSFDYTNQLGSGDGVALEVSNNGGSSYTTLASFSPASLFGTGTYSSSISAYIASNTRVRFRITGNAAPWASLFVDNVQIAYDTPTPTPTVTGTPTQTSTPGGATNTSTATSTPAPATNTPTSTSTPIVPTNTPAATGTPGSPHSGFTLATSACAICHRAHTAVGNNVTTTTTQSALCFSCHDGTGANSNVQSVYSDPSVPANNATTSSFYSHLPSATSIHLGGQEDEFAGVLNRHAECGDCHNPHTLDSSRAVKTSSGWTASGALTGSAGVAASPAYAYKNPVSLEAEVCFKCHSASTTLLSYTKESYKKTDKIYEFNPANASYHPVEAPGKNVSPQMATSLAGGTRWRFTTADTIRCVHCHGDPRVTAPTPSADARLGTHTSPYRGMLIANYRDRVRKSSGESYNANDFALCYLCHSAAPFTGNSPATRFNEHEKHVSGIGGEGGGSGTDIDVAGAGSGNSICAECHYRVHSTSTAPWPSNRIYQGGVNFAPNVRPVSGQAEPLWARTANGGNCTLRCHGKDHDSKSYP